MTVIAIALVGALVAGLVAGGRRSRLFNPPFARTGYLMLVVLSQISAMLSQHVSVMIMWLTLGVLGAVVYWRANRTRPGLLLIIAGLALNAFVVIINLGQPISVPAAQRAGLDVTAASLATDPRALPIDHETLLPWLGQVVAVPIPHWSSVASPGDIIVAGGVAVFLFTGLTGFGRRIPKTPEEERSERKAERGAKREKRAAADATLEGQIIVAGADPVTETVTTVPVADTDETRRGTTAVTLDSDLAEGDQERQRLERRQKKKQKKQKNKLRRERRNAEAGERDVGEAAPPGPMAVTIGATDGIGPAGGNGAGEHGAAAGDEARPSRTRAGSATGQCREA